MFTSPDTETALASELLDITHETELEHIVPRILKPALKGLPAVAPMVAKAAAPVLKKAAAKAIPKIRTATVRKPHAAVRKPHASVPVQSAYGGVDDFGFGSAVSTRDERLWGTTFQRSRPREIQRAMSLRFVQAARKAARKAAVVTLKHIRSGRPVTFETVRGVVYRALVDAVRERAPFLLPTMAAVSTALRQKQGYTGPALPHLRPGRIQQPRKPSLPRQKPGYTGPSLPTPRSRILGEL
jgi:hypothetical protein